MRLQKMSQGTLLPLTLEEDLGLCNLATKNDQRTFAWFCRLELIRYELGFLDKLDEDFLVPQPGIPMRMARREQRPSLGGRWDRNPGLCATGFFPLYGGNRCQNFQHSHVTRTHVDDVLDLVLTTICQDRYACDLTDVNADFLTMMAALVKSGICSKAR